MNKCVILIVDDEPEAREMIKRCLTRFMECQIYEAQTGEEALDKLKKINFDLVILDIKMPGLSGLDVMKEIKKYKNLPDTIVLTAWDSAQIATEAIEEGAMDYIPKPIITDILKLKVKTILEKKARFFSRENPL